VQAWSYHRANQFLTEDVILPELLFDNLSNVTDDIFNYTEYDSNDSVRERKIVHRKQSYSESQKALRKMTIAMILQMRGQPCG
jgi:hypothetical protein